VSTFSAIRTRCSVRFSDASFQIVTDAVWKDYVNAAYRRTIADEALFPNRELSTTINSVAQTRTLALPTDSTRILSIHDSTNFVKLEPLEGLAEHLRLWVTQTEDGVPVAYRIRNGSILLYPLPQGVNVYTVEYLGRPADLSGDSDLPAFPSQYHDILVEGALSDAYADDGNLKQQALHEARYHELFQAMRLDLLGERGERYYEPTDNFY
jgi:hypothetical protein